MRHRAGIAFRVRAGGLVGGDGDRRRPGRPLEVGGDAQALLLHVGGGALDGRPDGGREEMNPFIDLLDGGAGHDHSVVAEHRDARGPLAVAGLEDLALPFDLQGERDPGIRVVHPDRLVPEYLLGEGCAPGVAGDCVGGERVEVQHQGVGDEGVEEDLDAGAPVVVRQLGPLRSGADGILALGGGGVEGVEQCGDVEGDQILLPQSRQGDSTGLDAQGRAGLRRRVAASGPGELGVRSDPVAQCDEIRGGGGHGGLRIEDETFHSRVRAERGPVNRLSISEGAAGVEPQRAMAGAALR